MVDWLVKTVSKGEEQESARERLLWLVEEVSKGEPKERAGKLIDW